MLSRNAPPEIGCHQPTSAFVSRFCIFPSPLLYISCIIPFCKYAGLFDVQLHSKGRVAKNCKKKKKRRRCSSKNIFILILYGEVVSVASPHDAS